MVGAEWTVKEIQAVDWLLRIRQLRGQGLSIEEAVAQAEAEGY